MDWRDRKYYCVSFLSQSKDMRLNILKQIYGVKIRPYKNIKKQPDEIEERGYYQFLLGVPYNCFKTVEHEFEKAEIDDGYCEWKEIKKDTSKKYFDVLGFEMPYRRCEINPNKRCNHCMNC